MTRPDLPAGTGLGLGVLALLIVVAVLGERGDGGGGGGGAPVPPSAAALSVYDGRSPSEAGGSRERVLVELPRPALADRDDLDSLSPADQRAYLRSLSEEGRALRSALGARGVALRDAVTFGRTWDGFAATVDASDLAALSSLGVRARPVRRFYPATSEPVPVRGEPRAASGGGGPPIAILDTGAAAPGYDTLDRDGDPSPGADPRAPSRRETSGAALAAIVTAAGERAMTIRVAGYGSTPEIHGTTDTLIAGLERAVDPNGDGAVDDAVRVALVGVNAPYAGFGDSPEAQAVRGAGKLGTLVVAPAGNEGPARPPNGVVGSPGAARAALTAGATEAGAGVPRVTVTIGGRELAGATALGGKPLPGKLAGPVTSTDTAALLRGRRVAGRVALVRADDDPVAQATAAAGAGARAVILADPRDRPLPMMPSGRVPAPVVGLTGAAAKAALKGNPGAGVTFGRLKVERPKKAASGGGTASGGGVGAGGSAAAGPAPFSSRGPSFDGALKPDVLAEGAAVTPEGIVAGTAVAAAHMAVRAARLARQRPAETAAGIKEALVPAATEEEGAGPSPAVPLGPLELTRSGDEVVGVKFALGAFERGDPLAGGTTIQPASRLELELIDATDAVKQTLTPPDGARDLLPAEYAYRLTGQALKDLTPGEYRFKATARAPRRSAPTIETSPRFRVR
jgi:Subtilase family